MEKDSGLQPSVWKAGFRLSVSVVPIDHKQRSVFHVNIR